MKENFVSHLSPPLNQMHEFQGGGFVLPLSHNEQNKQDCCLQCKNIASHNFHLNPHAKEFIPRTKYIPVTQATYSQFIYNRAPENGKHFFAPVVPTVNPWYRAASATSAPGVPEQTRLWPPPPPPRASGQTHQHGQRRRRLTNGDARDKTATVAHRTESVAAPERHRTESVAVPEGQRTESVAAPEGQRTESVAAPEGQRTESVAAPEGQRTESVAVPEGQRTESVAAPEGRKTESVAAPEGQRTESVAAPEGHRTESVAVSEHEGMGSVTVNSGCNGVDCRPATERGQEVYSSAERSEPSLSADQRSECGEVPAPVSGRSSPAASCCLHRDSSPAAGLPSSPDDWDSSSGDEDEWEERPAVLPGSSVDSADDFICFVSEDAELEPSAAGDESTSPPQFQSFADQVDSGVSAETCPSGGDSSSSSTEEEDGEFSEDESDEGSFDAVLWRRLSVSPMSLDYRSSASAALPEMCDSCLQSPASLCTTHERVAEANRKLCRLEQSSPPAPPDRSRRHAKVRFVSGERLTTVHAAPEYDRTLGAELLDEQRRRDRRRRWWQEVERSVAPAVSAVLSPHHRDSVLRQRPELLHRPS